jgi:hypothetical protein
MKTSHTASHQSSRSLIARCTPLRVSPSATKYRITKRTPEVLENKERPKMKLSVFGRITDLHQNAEVCCITKRKNPICALKTIRRQKLTATSKEDRRPDSISSTLSPLLLSAFIGVHRRLKVFS